MNNIRVIKIYKERYKHLNSMSHNAIQRKLL